MHHRMGRVLYGVLVGVVSMGFRYFRRVRDRCLLCTAGRQQRVGMDRPHRGKAVSLLTHLQADAGKGEAE